MFRVKSLSMIISSLMLLLTTTSANIACTESKPLPSSPTSPPSNQVPQPALAVFSINKLSVTPLEVKAGEQITVTAEVSNSGSTEGSHTVELKVNNAIEAKETVTIAAGSVKKVNFVVSRDTPGTYKVTVGNLSQEFLVIKELSSFRAEILGENKYNADYLINMKNDGPGTVTRVLIRAALVTPREPQQKVVLTKLTPDSYTYQSVMDEYGNTFAEVNINPGIDPGKELTLKFSYQVVVNQLRYQFGTCEGANLNEYLKPEPLVESDNEEIVALARQITKDKASLCEKARAIYDWIGDNVSGTNYDTEDRGALYCLRNKRGDCSEFSALMIALCRAAGIPARQIEGLTYISETSLEPQFRFRHDWLEIYLPSTGWVPVDPTWGRFKDRRDQYFARNSPVHIVVTTGNYGLLGKVVKQFHYSEYSFGFSGEKPKVAYVASWQIQRAKD